MPRSKSKDNVSGIRQSKDKKVSTDSKESLPSPKEHRPTKSGSSKTKEKK